MPKFHVSVPEVRYQTVEIEAESMEHAVRRVLDGDGEYTGDLEYSHPLDVDEMSVKDLATGEEKRVQAAEPDDG
jgi:hypothetical protein